MNYRENEIRIRVNGLKKAIESEMQNIQSMTDGYYNQAREKYDVLIKALDDLLELYHESEKMTPAIWYDYLQVNEDGLHLFEQECGDLVSVPEAISLIGLGVNEQILRNILHLTDYLVAVKCKLPRTHGKIFISKKSALEFKKALALNFGLLLGLRSPLKKGIAPLKRVATTDEKLNEQLTPYLLPFE